MSWRDSARCRSHGDGGALRDRRATCGVCGWDGFGVSWPTRADTVVGYNGRSRAARRRDVKPNDHKTGRLGADVESGALRWGLHGGSARMAQPADRLALARVSRSVSEDLVLAEFLKG